MLGRWKTEFLERASDVFKKGPSEADKLLEEERQHVADLERKVGQLTYEVDWLKKSILEMHSSKKGAYYAEASKKGHI